MSDLADVYEETRMSLRDLLESRPAEDLDKPVPATPGWTVRNVVSHLIGDVECITRGDFPNEFFRAFGEPDAIIELNEWTDTQVSQRADRSVAELFKEWDSLVETLLPMMRGDQPWPDGVSSFADRVLVTDLGVHQHDVNGAFGIKRDRESTPVKIGASGYIAVLGLRLDSDGVGALALEAPGKRWVAGGEEPIATVRATRFELFRALSGRRSPDQLLDYKWDGDPKPFINYFYPYGVREQALVE